MILSNNVFNSLQNLESKPWMELTPVPTAVPPWANAKRCGKDDNTRSLFNLIWVAQPLNSCPTDIGVASWKWVLPWKKNSLSVNCSKTRRVYRFYQPHIFLFFSFLFPLRIQKNPQPLSFFGLYSWAVLYFDLIIWVSVCFCLFLN